MGSIIKTIKLSKFNNGFQFFFPRILAVTAVCLALQFLEPLRAQANPEYDRVYQLETLSWLRAYDNADGIFGDYIDEVYARYFKRQSRFLIKPLKGLDQVLGNTSMSYPDLIQNKDILKKIAQKFRSESLLRTKIYKEAETYRIVIEWVFAPHGDILAQTEFRYIDPKKEEGLEKSDLPNAIARGLDDLISKLPFLGQVTGIATGNGSVGDTITINLGKNQHVHSRETFTIYTLQEVKRHPILNTIEEWRWQAVGKAVVQEVEESISFAKVVDTEPNQSIQKYQKIREFYPAPADADRPETQEIEKTPPKLGWVAGNLGIGNYSREVGSPNADGRTGSGLSEGLSIDGLLWLNARWLAQASLGESFIKYSPSSLSTGTSTGSSYSGTSTQFRAAVGYTLIPAKSLFEPMGWVHLGYHYAAYDLAQSLTDYTGHSTFNSLFVGVGGDVPIAERIGAQLGLDIGLLRGGSQSSPTFIGDVSGSSDLRLNAGFTYHWNENWFLRLLFSLDSQSLEFSTGESVSQKLFLVSPSLMYYF